MVIFDGADPKRSSMADEAHLKLPGCFFIEGEVEDDASFPAETIDWCGFILIKEINFIAFVEMAKLHGEVIL
jgi:hypothetical protein